MESATTIRCSQGLGGTPNKRICSTNAPLAKNTLRSVLWRKRATSQAVSLFPQRLEAAVPGNAGNCCFSCWGRAPSPVNSPRRGWLRLCEPNENAPVRGGLDRPAWGFEVSLWGLLLQIPLEHRRCFGAGGLTAGVQTTVAVAAYNALSVLANGSRNPAHRAVNGATVTSPKEPITV